MKQCPFCDQRAYMEYERPNWHVQCSRCGAAGPHHTSPERAQEGWNTRVYNYDMPAISRKIERLEIMIEICRNAYPDIENTKGWQELS